MSSDEKVPLKKDSAPAAADGVDRKKAIGWLCYSVSFNLMNTIVRRPLCGVAHSVSLSLSACELTAHGRFLRRCSRRCTRRS